MKKAIIISALFIFPFLMFCDNDKDNSNTIIISDEAKAYADEHWRPKRYSYWDGFYYGWLEAWKWGACLGPYYSVLDTNEHLEYELPDTNTDEYYRMISEHDQFLYGWDDIHDHLEICDLKPTNELIVLIDPEDCYLFYGGDDHPEICYDTLYYDNWVGNVISERRIIYRLLIESGNNKRAINPLSVYNSH